MIRYYRLDFKTDNPDNGIPSDYIKREEERCVRYVIGDLYYWPKECSWEQFCQEIFISTPLIEISKEEFERAVVEIVLTKNITE